MGAEEKTLDYESADLSPELLSTKLVGLALKSYSGARKVQIPHL